jgi:hypothetical protein
MDTDSMKRSVLTGFLTNPTVRGFASLVLMVGIGFVCYMVLAPRLGFYNDDWYLLYAGTSQGGHKFLDIFAIDRPFRGYFVGWIFSLFGVNAWLYSLGAFVMRCVAALGWFWILRQVWPQHRQMTYVVALLSLVYPGFLDQPNAFDFQSHQWGFALGVLSIACTVGAFRVRRLWAQGTLVILSLATQIVSYLLMEYYIGLEGLRFLLVAYLAWQVKVGEQPSSKQHPGKPSTGWLWRALGVWLPALLVALGFLYWQTQILAVGRAATDVNQMLEGIGKSPALRLAWMGINMLEDLMDVVIFAWTEPVYHLAFSLRLKLILLEMALAGAAGLMCWGGLRLLTAPQKDEPATPAPLPPAWTMVLIGVLSAAAALFPIHLGNRQVEFASFSRFSLTPSLGAVLVVVGVWLALCKRPPTAWLAVMLVCLAVLTHVGNTLIHAEYSDVVRNFWWQVSWRIPQLEPGTVLLADYAGKGINEDYFVWGPANLIYYPVADPANPDQLLLSSVTLNRSDTEKILTQGHDTLNRRSIIAEKDYSKLLVLSMATEFSCVDVLDNTHLELTEQTNPAVVGAAPYSKISQIIISDNLRTPPEAIFGPEPAHGWCYYYQKASLARQRGDWEDIVRLGDMVRQQNLRPYDWIEWMPFIEAYAYLGDGDAVDTLAPILREKLFYRMQACHLAETDPWNMAAQYPDGQQLLVEALCGSKQ